MADKQKRRRQSDETAVGPTECRNCGSTDRDPYTPCARHEHDGQILSFDRTRCQACGQHRIDKSVVTDT